MPSLRAHNIRRSNVLLCNYRRSSESLKHKRLIGARQQDNNSQQDDEPPKSKVPGCHERIFNLERATSYGGTETTTNNHKLSLSCSVSFNADRADKDSNPAKYYGGAGGAGNNDDPEAPGRAPAVADIIGSFGLFQMLVLLFSGLRESLVGYDALILSVVLQPETKFLCKDNLKPMQINDTSHYSSPGDFDLLIKGDSSYSGSSSSSSSSMAQCFRSDDGGQTPLLDPQGEPLECHSWVFANETAKFGPSLVAEWSLVCQNHWQVAFIESAYFFGLVTGNLIWGFCADKFGRRPAYLTAHTVSLIFGSLAIFMPSVYPFALCRFLAAMGSIGYNIIYSIQVELIGVKHRSFSTLMNHLGWGLGVICIPVVDHLFDDYRPVIAVAPLLSLIMYPWAFWLPESSRWLMANERFEEARLELIREARFNGKSITPTLEKKIWALEQKVRLHKWSSDRRRSGASLKRNRSYRLIFTDPVLVKDTLVLAYIMFVGHMFYYLLTINFAYVKNLSTEANFITSGAGEWVSVLVGALLLRFFTRKTCMSLFLSIMAVSFAFQSLVESELVPELDTQFFITLNNALGTLSSLLLIFIALIVNQEVFPTIVRQTGTSMVNTLGEFGSTLAPGLVWMSRFSPWKANAFYTILCSLGVVVTQSLTRTDDIELPDT